MLANGDIDSPQKAKAVLAATGADGLLIGRAAQGRPWIFREIEHYLRTGEQLPAPSLGEVERILLEHLTALHAFYGDVMGVRIARKTCQLVSRNLAGRQGVSRPIQSSGQYGRAVHQRSRVFQRTS